MLARLPIPLRPAHHELLTSYVSRLAQLHGLSFDELWAQVSEPEHARSRRRQVVPDRLAALTGRPHHVLAAALPELRGPDLDWTTLRHEPQPGCPRCDARHRGGPVTRLLAHHHYVCLRHRCWIGPPDIAAPATPLAVLPEVVHTQRRHLRLVRRHGPAATYDAVLTGFLICGHLWSQPAESGTDTWWHWPRRTQLLVPDRAAFTASRMFAATYPEAVAVAAVLASPAWRARAHGDDEQRRLFAIEIGRRLGRPDYQPRTSSDAIAHWAHDDSWRPPVTPTRTYLDTRRRCSNHVFSPGRQNQARHDRSQLFFSHRRGGGNIILHHRHIRPVLIRPWSQPMEVIEGAIWASARVDQREPTTQTRTAHRPARGSNPWGPALAEA